MTMKTQYKEQALRVFSVVSSALFLLWLLLFVQDSLESRLNTARSHDSIQVEDLPRKDAKKAVKHYNQAEADCLTEALFYEARGTSIEAMKNVAYVVLNRKEAKGFPSTICDVIKQPKQFSYRNNFTPRPDWQKVVLSKDSKDKEALLKIKQITKKVLKEGSKNKDVLWYTTPEVKKPWMKNLVVKYNDGYHKHFARKES